MKIKFRPMRNSVFMISKCDNRLFPTPGQYPTVWAVTSFIRFLLLSTQRGSSLCVESDNPSHPIYASRSMTTRLVMLLLLSTDQLAYGTCYDTLQSCLPGHRHAGRDHFLAGVCLRQRHWLLNGRDWQRPGLLSWNSTNIQARTMNCSSSPSFFKAFITI